MDQSGVTLGLELGADFTDLGSFFHAELLTSDSEMSSRSTRTNVTTNTRRNLFHQHLSRRPTASSTAGTSATTIQAVSEDTGDEIVVRDKNGNYQFELPVMPIAGQDEVMEKESMFGSRAVGPLLRVDTR